MKQSLALKIASKFNEAYFDTPGTDDYIARAYVEHDVINPGDCVVIITSRRTEIRYEPLKLAMKLCSRYKLLMFVQSGSSLRIIIHAKLG